MRPFAIYYGWPSEVNGAGGDVGRAVAALAPAGLVVFGDDTVTPDGDPAAPQVLAGLAARGGVPYGYVSVGVTHGEPDHPLAVLHARLDAWRAIGARGVLLDCAGADYGVSRARFDDVVRHAHSIGLRVLANAWDPDDVLAGPTSLRAGDGYLGENDVLSDGVLRDPAVYGPKLDRMAAYKERLGIELFETATTSGRHATAAADRVLEVLGRYPIDGFQLTDPLYSARDNVLAPPLAELHRRSR